MAITCKYFNISKKLFVFEFGAKAKPRLQSDVVAMEKEKRSELQRNYSFVMATINLKNLWCKNVLKIHPRMTAAAQGEHESVISGN